MVSAGQHTCPSLYERICNGQNFFLPANVHPFPLRAAQLAVVLCSTCCCVILILMCVAAWQVGFFAKWTFREP